MYEIKAILAMLIQTASMLIIIWFILGLLFAFNVVGRDNRFLVEVDNALAALFRPVLNPIRRIMPDTGMIDFSPMVLILIMNAILIIL